MKDALRSWAFWAATAAWAVAAWVAIFMPVPSPPVSGHEAVSPVPELPVANPVPGEERASDRGARLAPDSRARAAAVAPTEGDAA